MRSSRVTWQTLPHFSDLYQHVSGNWGPLRWSNALDLEALLEQAQHPSLTPQKEPVWCQTKRPQGIIAPHFIFIGSATNPPLWMTSSHLADQMNTSAIFVGGRNQQHLHEAEAQRGNRFSFAEWRRLLSPYVVAILTTHAPLADGKRIMYLGVWD
jgi:hypothetical protein